MAAGAFFNPEQAREMIEDFLDGLNWGHEPRTNLDTPLGKMEAYVVSVYTAAMTLTTVGYGDIAAENTAERVGFTVLFVGGAFLWGTLLAEVGEVHRLPPLPPLPALLPVPPTGSLLACLCARSALVSKRTRPGPGGRPDRAQKPCTR